MNRKACTRRICGEHSAVASVLDVQYQTVVLCELEIEEESRIASDGSWFPGSCSLQMSTRLPRTQNIRPSYLF